MNSAQFNEIVERRLRLTEDVLDFKGEEYARENRFHNFIAASCMLGCSPEKALLGMWSKHVVSIIDMVNDLPTAPRSAEYIEEKIGDAINYLILLEGMLKERLT